jgi:hypothetical protein
MRIIRNIPEVRTGNKVASMSKKPKLIPTCEMKSLEEILGYKNSRVIERYEDELNLSGEEAETLFRDVLLFLYVCGTTDRKSEITPTKAIDEGWHEFIMFTKDYGIFCKEYFGIFIHHNPFTRSDRASGRGSPMKVAIDLAEKASSKPLSKNWDASVTAVGECNCNGAGNCSGDCCPVWG